MVSKYDDSVDMMSKYDDGNAINPSKPTSVLAIKVLYNEASESGATVQTSTPIFVMPI